MIIKGKAQGGAAALAKHLARLDHNERVRVIDSQGLFHEDIAGAMRELDELGAAADTKRTLYHGIIAPRAGEGLTEEQRREAVRRMAERLGLAGQAFVVVGHVKPGEEEHFHIVWSRVDQERQAGISDSHNYRKHEELNQELAQEFGFAQVRGVHTRSKGQEPRPERTPDHWEMQQQQRTGAAALIDARADITQAWRETRTGAEFVDELAARGYIIARGDRKDFVVIDAQGGLHGLARRVEGARAKDIRERMADVDADELEDVNQARRRQRELRVAAELAAELESGRGAVSAAERMRAEELEGERQARSQGGRLNQADREAFAAVRMLERLGSVTNVVGEPITNSTVRQAVREALHQAGKPEAAAAPAVPAPPREAPAEHRETIMEKLDREAKERGDAPIVVKIVPRHEQHREHLRRLVHRPDREDEPRP